MSSELWAKSPRHGDTPPSVIGHNRDVHHAAVAVWESIEHDLAVALQTDAAALRAELLPLLCASALLHDLGKINSAFQAMIRAVPGQSSRQPVRHEVMTAWLMTDADYFGKWFTASLTDPSFWPVVWAIAGHHLKMGDPANGAKLFALSDARFVTVPLSDSQVGDILREVANALGQSLDPPKLSEIRFDTTDDEECGLERRIAAFAEQSSRMWQRLRRNEPIPRRTALLKALLISSDAAASALTPDRKDPPQWIRPALAQRIVSGQLNGVIAESLDGEAARPFQLRVGASAGSATVVVAGCGNGKTTAAYMWANKHAIGRKLFFTYPTTGTASAGFEDYLFGQKTLASELIHGRASVDLQAMRGTGEKESDDYLRIDSLRAWDRHAIVCTVDTVLGLLQNNRRPMYSFPAIAAGAFVFDEIHSYDARLFGGLLQFLRTFPGLPVLLMSASIPPDRMKVLKDVLGRRLGEVIRGDPDLEGYQRYRFVTRASAAHCKDDIIQSLRSQKKVLWVCNTVRDCVEIARIARADTGTEPIIFHSRFRYRDRVNRQKDLIARFNSTGAALAITTQVCEMSLDISADLLVTAECPLPSLVQRLGRLNRFASADDPWPCLVYPFTGTPYNEEPAISSMNAARALVAKFDGQSCRQRDLADWLDGMTDTEPFQEYSAWLNDGWLTEPAPVRDADLTITIIREEDLVGIEEAVGPRKCWTHGKLVPWTIPMLYRRSFFAADTAGGYPVVPMGSVRYCNTEGATWASERS